MRGKLVLITNKKSHMGFWLVPKSVTLNDLERRNGRVMHYFAELCSFWGPKLCKSGWRYTDTFCEWNVTPKNLVFNGISPIIIFAGNHPSKGVKVKRPPVASKNTSMHQQWIHQFYCGLDLFICLISSQFFLINFQLSVFTCTNTVD